MGKYWLALVFLFPNVILAGKYTVYAGCEPVISIKESRNNICLDSAVVFKAKVENKGTNSVYRWKRNNVNVGTNSPDYSADDFHEGDSVVCEYSCTTTCGTDATVISNAVIIHVVNDIMPVISVANADSIICEGELTYFTTKASYGNAIPAYQWKVNNAVIADTTPFYTTDSLTNGSKVECVLTISTSGCPAKISSSSWMAIYVYPMIHPAIKITPSQTNICRGEEVIFYATANGGPTPSLKWEVNGVPTGDSGYQFITASLKDGDIISCTVTIDQDSRCFTSTNAPSNKVVMHVKDYPDPSITVDAPLSGACRGTALTFSATTKNTGSFSSYQWYINDKAAGSNLPVFITKDLADGDKVSCSLSTDIPGCNLIVYPVSNYKQVIIRDTPVIAFSPPDTAVFSGESVQLKASVTGSPASFIWKPDSLLLTPQSLISFTKPLGETTVFNLSLIDLNGCSASSFLPVKVLYKMHMPSAFTPNKDGRNDVFIIPSGSSVTLQQFSVYDRWGHVIFTTADISKGWDGTYRGFNLPAGTYVYLIRGTIEQQKLVKKGTVTLIR